MTLRLRLLTLFALGVSGVALWIEPSQVAPLPVSPVPSAQAEAEPAPPVSATELHVEPSRPASLNCEQAKIIVAEARSRLAEPVRDFDEALFAELTVGWLDPHGLWTAAPDTPAHALVYEVAGPLRHELEGRGRDCAEALRVGKTLEDWVSALGPIFDAARLAAPRLAAADAYELVESTIFEDDPVTLPAGKLASELGRRVGVFDQSFPGAAPWLGEAARAHYFPSLTAEDWTRVVLVASVRAYVATIDPHGQWVPREEEGSLYADDPTFPGGPELWGDVLRTPIGVRIADEPMAPLELDDLVLAVDGVPTAGLSIEEVDELARFPDEEAPFRHVLVLRQATREPETLLVALEGEELEEATGTLAVERVPYADGYVAAVRIPDVPDELGAELAELVRELTDPEPAGMLLDLRGNGGGSTDGACSALGVFLPGAPVFPLLYRGKVVEVLRAAQPRRGARFSGPVAALVDGRTASAAEMIAGALESYGRGPAIGSRTFGKGCVQEYFDDAAGAGILRLTTLLYTLPDGSPVQRVGLAPSLLLPLSAPADEGEREADLEGALQAQSGPDVRMGHSFEGPVWPDHRGRVGPCSEPAICAALRRIGGAQAASRAQRSPFHPAENGRSRR